jgi:dTMP kinase
VASTGNFFLVIEGLDGTGKSSMSAYLAGLFRERAPAGILATYEPHDPSCGGDFIRQVLTKKIKNVPARTLGLAFAANRADHCDREIRPFLSGGEKRVVICDRYYLSSLVYQSLGGLSFDEIMALNRDALHPDLTLFLTASARVCYQRIRKRSEDRELFEKNLDQTKARYDEAIKFLAERGEKIVTVGVEKDFAEAAGDVAAALKGHLPEWLAG